MRAGEASAVGESGETILAVWRSGDAVLVVVVVVDDDDGPAGEPDLTSSSDRRMSVTSDGNLAGRDNQTRTSKKPP